MPRNKFSKKPRVIPLFTAIPFDIIDSECFQRLTNAARTAYLLLCRQKGTDFFKSEVICPYSIAEKYMDRKTWRAAIIALSNSRFIAIDQKGGLYRKTNIYRFTADWRITIDGKLLEGGYNPPHINRLKPIGTVCKSTPHEAIL